MGTSSSKSEVSEVVEVSEVASTETKKLKPCCACPETKRARDSCIIEKGEDNCKDLIEAHRECMRKHGFKI